MSDNKIVCPKCGSENILKDWTHKMQLELWCSDCDCRWTDWQQAEIGRLKKDYLLSPSEYCRKYQVQKCHVCDDPTCGDNQSPLKKEIDRLRAELDALILKNDTLVKVLHYIHFVLTDTNEIKTDLCDETQIAADTLKAELEKLKPDNRPKIICLCGSTKFKDAFDEANYQETMSGKIVLSVGFSTHATGNKHSENIGATPEQKIELDELHKRKIDLADEVLVLNVNSYIGESTRSEIEYAKEHGKPIRYLKPEEI